MELGLDIQILRDDDGRVSLRGRDTYGVRGLIKAKNALWIPAEQKWLLPMEFDEAKAREFLSELQHWQQNDPALVENANDIFSPKKKKLPYVRRGRREETSPPPRRRRKARRRPPEPQGPPPPQALVEDRMPDLVDH
jgi:hypothetical protein